MRHLFVTNDFPPKLGGIESYLTNLLKGFDPKDVTVVAPTREGHEEVDAELPYEVVRLPASYLRATRRVYSALVDTIRRRKPKAVLFLAALPLGRLGPRLGAQTGVAWSVVAHGTGEILLPARVPLARRALRNVLVSADVVLPVSEFTRAEVDRVTRSKARTVLLPPSVDTERFSLDVSGAEVRAKHQLGSSFVVAFVSRLVKRKGADVLIRAIVGMRGTSALIVGTGPENASLQRLVRESDAADRVVFAGRISDEALPSYYAAADVFCMPCTSRYGGLDTEGFGVVYLEAQATGLPCVAGRCGGSAEAVEDGVTGVVLDEPTPQTVGSALVDLRKDPARCALLGGAGRSRMEREFAPAVAAARLEEAMKEALG
ncbi:MAG: glycosyltransferase family 4 protein [Actinomycetota bacterium]